MPADLPHIHQNLPMDINIIAGAVIMCILFVLSEFFGGFFQHIGVKSANRIFELVLSNKNTRYTADELQEQTLQLHEDIAEFQTRIERERTRDFQKQSRESLTTEEMEKIHNQRSIRRDERKGEFLKRFAPQLEMLVQEYERRNISPDDDMMDFESLRWWAKQGEVRRLLPVLRHLAQKVEIDKQQEAA